jgi:VanZ family protein
MKVRGPGVNDLPLLLRRIWWAIGWFGVALAVYLSLMHNPPTLDVEQGDKLQHLAAYGTLMLWFSQLSVGLRRRRLTAVALVALGIAIEYMQLATGYRDFSDADRVADAIGVALGWILAPPRLPNLLALTTRVLSRSRPAS